MNFLRVDLFFFFPFLFFSYFVYWLGLKDLAFILPADMYIPAFQGQEIMSIQSAILEI